MNFLAFDIETARLTPAGEEFLAHRPLGISCYAPAWRDAEGVHHQTGFGQANSATPQPQMSRAECAALVTTLQERVRQGYTLLTWNGLGFDLDILAEESGLHAACCELACAHVDMMFYFFCLQGYPLGLDSAAKGMGLAGKSEGMDGAQAPLFWQQGKFEEVLSYVAQDVKTTLELCEAVTARHQIRWRTRGGKANRVKIAAWLPVHEALALPLPDNNWLRHPMTRDRFTGWMEQPR
jgi:hypothetical protein